MERHTEVNADTVLRVVLDRIEAAKPGDLRLVVCDLSASPFLDLAGSEMLPKLHAQLAARKIPLRIVGARRRVRELLRNVMLYEKVGSLGRGLTLNDVLKANGT
jgi:sulfate permease, SulP family